MLKIKRFVNNKPACVQELYKNEISDEGVYKILSRVKNREKEKAEEKE